MAFVKGTFDPPQEAQAQDEPQSEETEEITNPLELFDIKIRDDVEGLIYLGELTSEVKYAGHRFGLRTLRPEYRYTIGRVIQPLRNTLFEVNAWRDAHVACALTHVDGDYKFCEATSNSIEDFVRGRWQYLTDSDTGWFPPVLDFLWSEYQKLENHAAGAVKQLDFLSNKGISSNISSPSFLDTLSVLGASGAPIDSEFLASLSSDDNS